MTITLEINASLEDVLLRQAAAQGVAVDAYAAGLLEEAAQSAERQESTAVDLTSLFLPLRGLDIEFERDRDTGREIEL